MSHVALECAVPRVEADHALPRQVPCSCMRAPSRAGVFADKPHRSQRCGRSSALSPRSVRARHDEVPMPFGAVTRVESRRASSTHSLMSDVKS